MKFGLAILTLSQPRVTDNVVQKVNLSAHLHCEHSAQARVTFNMFWTIVNAFGDD